MGRRVFLGSIINVGVRLAEPDPIVVKTVEHRQKNL